MSIIHADKKLIIIIHVNFFFNYLYNEFPVTDVICIQINFYFDAEPF